MSFSPATLNGAGLAAVVEVSSAVVLMDRKVGRMDRITDEEERWGEKRRSDVVKARFVDAAKEKERAEGEDREKATTPRKVERRANVRREREGWNCAEGVLLAGCTTPMAFRSIAFDGRRRSEK